MNVNGLFPTPVASFELNRAFTESELSFLLQDAPRVQNANNRTSEDNYILDRPELEGLKAFVMTCGEEYAREVWKVQQSCGLRLTQSWANYTNSVESHHRHNHSNALFSGVLYINTRDDDKIYFFRDQRSTLRPTYEEINLFNAESWWLPATTGTLYLFPSAFEHAVPSAAEGGERCSLAFNFFPIGLLGDRMGLTEVRL